MMKVVGLLVLSLAIGGQCQLDGLNLNCGQNGSALDNLQRYGQYCGNLFSSWYFNTVTPPIRRFEEVEIPIRFQIGRSLEYGNSTELWDTICRWGDSMKNCLRNILPFCDDGIGAELLTNPAATPYFRGRRGYFYDSQDLLMAFYRRTCVGRTVEPAIRTLLDDSTFNRTIPCLNSSHHENLHRCIEPLREELREVRVRTFTDLTEVLRRTISRMAAGSLSCMYSIINTSPCNDVTKKVMYQVARLQIPSVIRISDLNVTETTTGDFTSVLRCTVGVYGDPHLRLCWQPRLVTCSAPGEQIYISNDFFSVTAENVEIGRLSNRPIRATSVRSIQIIFKAISDSSIVGTYSGEGGDLPDVFDNTNSTTIGQGDDRVSLILDRYNRRVLVQHSTGMVLALRQWSGNYFFTLRAAASLIQSSFGLLSTGCPTKQIIGLGGFVGFRPATRRRRAVTVEQCEMACNETTDITEFRETCVFDCYVTENVTFAVNMTREANEDVDEVITRDDELRAEALPPTTTTVATTTVATPTTTKRSNASSRQSPLSYLLSFFMVLMGALFTIPYGTS